jgi:hypothetical protein
MFTTCIFLNHFHYRNPQGQAARICNVPYLVPAPIKALLATHTLLPVVLGWLIGLVVMVPPSTALLEIQPHARGTWLDLIPNIFRGAVINPFILLIMTSVLYSASGLGLLPFCHLSLGFW